MSVVPSYALLQINKCSLDKSKFLMAFPIFYARYDRKMGLSTEFQHCGICLTKNAMSYLLHYQDLSKIALVYNFYYDTTTFAGYEFVVYYGEQLTDIVYCSKCCKMMRKESWNKHTISDAHKVQQHLILYPIQQHLCEVMEHLIRNHSFDEWNDELKRINFPYLTRKIIKSLLYSVSMCTRDIIITEISYVTSITLYIDGWSKQRSYEGVYIGFELFGEHIKRFLSLMDLGIRAHTAKNLDEALNELDSIYHFKNKVTVMTSDSTNLMPCLANINNWHHDGCLNHKFNNEFNIFFKSLPESIRKSAESCNTLHSNPQLFTHMEMNSMKTLKNFTPTRWLTVVTCLQSYIESYECISEWLTGKAHIKVEWDQNPDDLIIIQNILLHCNKFVLISKQLESGYLDPGKRGDLLCQGRVVIHEMMANSTLLGFLPGWKNICEKFLSCYDKAFFNPESEACVRQMAATFFFVDDSSLDENDATLIEEMMFFVYRLGIDFTEMLHEVEMIHKKGVSESSDNISYSFLYQFQDEYTQLFAFAQHMVRFPGSNAHIERFFSMMTKVLPSWKSSYSSETFRTIAFLKGNIDIAKGLLLGYDYINSQKFFSLSHPLLHIRQMLSHDLNVTNTILKYLEISNEMSKRYCKESLDRVQKIKKDIAMYQIYIQLIWWIDYVKFDPTVKNQNANVNQCVPFTTGWHINLGH